MKRARKASQVPLIERRGSILIVLILIFGIACMIGFGMRSNPKLSLDPALLGTTENSLKSSVSASKQTIPTNVVALSPLGDMEEYDADNLYIKINGRAEQYLSYGFVKLQTQSYADKNNPSAFIDLYEYDMGTPRQAFGIFSLERDPNGEVLNFIRHGYRNGQSYFFRQGQWYVQVICSGRSQVLADAAFELAEERAKVHSENDEGLEALNKLPELGKVIGSEVFVAHNAMGYSSLENTNSADYTFENETIKFFISELSDASKAQAAYDEIKKTAQDFGQILHEGETADAKVFISESYGSWDVIFIRGIIVGGVSGAPNREPAEHFVDTYLNQSH